MCLSMLRWNLALDAGSQRVECAGAGGLAGSRLFESNRPVVLRAGSMSMRDRGTIPFMGNVGRHVPSDAIHGTGVLGPQSTRTGRTSSCTSTMRRGSPLRGGACVAAHAARIRPSLALSRLDRFFWRLGHLSFPPLSGWEGPLKWVKSSFALAHCESLRPPGPRQQREYYGRRPLRLRKNHPQTRFQCRPFEMANAVSIPQNFTDLSSRTVSRRDNGASTFRLSVS